MTIVRPRLNDFFGLPFTQDEVDFAIPFLDEDVPLYLDPFLLWKSPSQQDNALHTSVVNSFNYLGNLFNQGKTKEAVQNLILSSECDEVGLGDSRKRVGKPIGEALANEILNLFRSVPQVTKSGFIHFEEIQLLVDQVSKDRVSDIACTFLKSFLIDYTIDQCQKHGIPIEKVQLSAVFQYKTNSFRPEKLTCPLIHPRGSPSFSFRRDG